MACTTPSGERCKQSRQHRYILDFANADHESSATANCKSKIVDGMRESVKRCMESQHPRVLITNHRKTTCFKRSPKPETDLYRGFPMGWCWPGRGRFLSERGLLSGDFQACSSHAVFLSFPNDLFHIFLLLYFVLSVKLFLYTGLFSLVGLWRRCNKKS